MVKNNVGLDELEMRLDVLGAPTVPKGFLEISGVNPTGCKLAWKKPEDDGGSPILGYTVEKKDVERDTWVACGKLTGKTMAVMKVMLHYTPELHSKEGYNSSYFPGRLKYLFCKVQRDI